MKLQLDFDNKEITILDSEPLSKINQILKDLGIGDDWKIKSKQTIQIVEKQKEIYRDYCSPSIPTYPNLPYSPDFFPYNPNHIIC